MPCLACHFLRFVFCTNFCTDTTSSTPLLLNPSLLVCRVTGILTSSRLIVIAVDPEAQEYYLQMFYDETRGAIYTYSLKTGKLLRTYILPGMPSNPRYDPILKVSHNPKLSLTENRSSSG